MSIEKNSATAASDAAPATPAPDAAAASAAAAPANATAASADAVSPSAETPKIEPSAAAAAPHQADAPAAETRTAQLMIFDPLIAAAHDKVRSGAFRQLPLAAVIALAAVLGGLAGAAATAQLSRGAASPAPDIKVATQALQDNMAQLGHDIAALKASIAVVQRNTGLQSGKLSERLERIEKGQAEPATKLAKLADAVDRLERRPASAASQSSADVTGSIAGPKHEAKPVYAEGWWLRDYYDGRAVVESRNGRFFEVGPGSSLPGLGRVDAIKREDGRVVVVTRNGLIAAAVEPRRVPMPYRY